MAFSLLVWPPFDANHAHELTVTFQTESVIENTALQAARGAPALTGWGPEAGQAGATPPLWPYGLPTERQANATDQAEKCHTSVLCCMKAVWLSIYDVSASLLHQAALFPGTKGAAAGRSVARRLSGSGGASAGTAEAGAAWLSSSASSSLPYPMRAAPACGI